MVASYGAAAVNRFLVVFDAFVEKHGQRAAARDGGREAAAACFQGVGPLAPLALLSCRGYFTRVCGLGLGGLFLDFGARRPIFV